jgi:N-sulfoglucosamine sulfohydrolase
MVRSVRDSRYRYVRNFMPFTPYLPYLDYAEKCNTMKEMRRLYAEEKLNNIQVQWMVDRRPGEELYDLEKDPWETKNLAGDAAYAGIKKRLEKVLNEWMIETRDTGLLPEPMMKSLAKEYGSEYAILRQAGGEGRVKKLLQLAIIASKPKGPDREVIYEALESGDAAVRYWAVIALGQLTPSNDIEKLQRAAIDDDVSVRIAAARSLYWAGRKEEVIELLVKELKKFDEPEEVLHFALDVLEKMGDDAKGAIGTVKRLNAVRSKTKYINRIAEHLIEKYKGTSKNSFRRSSESSGLK